MAALGDGPSSALDSTFGALLIGVFFAIFLQGLLTVQAWNYYEDYPDDMLRLKFLVFIVWVLDTIHLVVICQTIYHYLVTNWGYQPALLESTPELFIHIFLIGLSCFACQTFFLQRIWIFSDKNKLVFGLVLAICLVTLGLNVHLPLQLLIGHYSIPQLAVKKPEVTALFLTGALSDILIAGLLCYYLRFSDHRSDFQATRTIVGKVLQYAVATGLITSALEVAAVIAFFVRPNDLYYIAMHLMLGRLYTNALLATLNARKKIRETLKESHGAGHSQSGDTIQTPRPVKILSMKPVEASHKDQSHKRLKSRASDIRYTVERTIHQDASDANGDIELGIIDAARKAYPLA